MVCANSLKESATNISRVNAKGEFVYIKYHFLADHGQKQFTADESLKYGGEDPDYSKRELWRKIENGEQLTWTAHIQIMQPEEADPAKLGFDPFDVTKVWPKKQFPVRISYPVPSELVNAANKSATRVWQVGPEQEPGELPPRRRTGSLLSW
jgi:hypothetical protein